MAIIMPTWRKPTSYYKGLGEGLIGPQNDFMRKIVLRGLPEVKDWSAAGALFVNAF
jgi:hypothetical protein